MQKSYETFIEELKSGIHEATGIVRENMHFEKEGGKYAPVGDRLLVKFAEHEDAWKYAACIPGNFTEIMRQELPWGRFWMKS